MQKLAERFADVMFFDCPDCTLAISLSLTSDMRNFEGTDGHSYLLQCFCGWSGGLFGALARRHWVDPDSSQPEKLSSASFGFVGRIRSPHLGLRFGGARGA